MSDPPFRQPGLAGSSTLSALAASAPEGVPDQSGLLGGEVATTRRQFAFGLGGQTSMAGCCSRRSHVWSR